MQVVILKQPLYGTVIWDGTDFIYTANPGLSGVNDYYTFSKTVNGVSTIQTNYVNTVNTPPVANNLSFVADATQVNVYNASQLAVDTSNTFNQLVFVGVSGAQFGTAYFSGDKLYYKSNGYKSVDVLSYTVSDKQYTATGTLTLSVTNGAEINTDPVGITTVLNTAETVNILDAGSKNWDGALTVTETYSGDWDSVNYPRYNNFSQVVETENQTWTDFYSSRDVLNSFETTVRTNSGIWNTNKETGSAYYDEFKPKSDNYSSSYSTLTANSAFWSSVIPEIVSLNNDITSLSTKLDSVSSTINYNTVTTQNWDTTELNQISADYFSKWDSLSTLKSAELDQATTNLNTLSSNLTNTSVSANSESLYSTVTTQSANWNVGDLAVITNDVLNKWNSATTITNQNKDGWSSTYSSTTALSSTFSDKIPQYDSVSNTVSAEKDNWNLSNIISSVSSTCLTGSSANDFTANDIDVHNLFVSQGSITITGELKRYNTTYVTANSFTIYNENSEDALEVNKIGGGGLVASFNNSSNPVLFVDSNNTVGINTLSGGTHALTVGGDISASGQIKPYLTQTITQYSASSASYESVFTALSSNSATTIAALTSEKGNYDNLANYVTLSSSRIDTLLSSDKQNYDAMYSVVGSQSANNAVVNSFIALSTAYIDIDPEFVKNKPKYDDLYTKYQLLTS
jgi:hypothetical protein